MRESEAAGWRPSVWRLVRVVVEPRTWAVTGYLLVMPLTATLWVTVVFTGFVVGLGTVIVWVGVLLLAVLPFFWRAGARLERMLAGAALGADIARPYRPMAQGSVIQRGLAVMRDPATWKDLLYLVLLLPLGMVWSLTALQGWEYALTLLAAPLYYYALPQGQIHWLGFGGWGPVVVVDTLPTALLASLAGLVLTVPVANLVRGVGYLHGVLARALLGPSKAQLLARQAAQLRASRDRTVDAAAAERRRIERDLHDGAQQRLVSVAMELGRARQKLTTEPDTARPLVEQAHGEVKRAIAELRDLARGIHPAVLSDRGLNAALSALAGRSPVPVEVNVELTDRPPAAVEAVAYFVVAEALTNVARHARASRAWVSIGSPGDHILVEVHDDGVGRAVPSPGSGLAGLDDRVAGVGGSLEVSSPAGGPTIVRAELPCE